MQQIIPSPREPDGLRTPDWRQVLLATLAVAGTLVVFWLLFQFRNIILILLAAIVLATAVQPVIAWLRRHGLTRNLAAVITYLLLVLILLAAGLLIAPLLVDQVAAITSVIPEYYDGARQFLLRSSSWPVRRLAAQLPTQLPLLPGSVVAGSLTEAETLSRMNQTFSFVGIGLRALLGIASVFLLAFYWSLERDRTIGWLVSLLPLRLKRTAHNRVIGIEAKLGVFLAAQGTLCLIIGGASLAAYLVIGLPYALLLAVLAGLAEAIPLIGPLLGAVPALLIALTLDPSKVVGVLIVTAIIQVAENNLIVPKVMSRAVGANPIVTLVTFLVFSYLLGMAGAFLSVPVAVVIQWLADRTVQTLETSSETPTDLRNQISVLRYQAQELARDVRKQMRQDGDVTSPVDEIGDAIEAVADELNSYLADIEEEKSI